MELPNADLKYCIEKANEIAEQYCLTHIGSDSPERFVDYLRRTCESYLDKTIGLQELHIDKDSSPVLASCILLADGNIDVCYVQNLNHCWTRFVICKEIFHLVLDAEEYRNMDLEAHIEEVTVKFPDASSVASPPVRAEMLAEMAAMEFLFPYAARLKELSGSNTNNKRAIAERYRVPAVLVERYMSPQYIDGLSAVSKH
jgi:hypothetical protein